MFISQPQYEFPFPADMANPGVQHWRMVELSIHAPWFMLSMEIIDGDDPEVRLTRTMCIAWDNDLAEVLRLVDADRIKGLVCMMPAWQSATGQWASREVREVWLRRSDAGKSVVLCDAAGEEFDCGLAPDHVGTVEQDLILRLSPAMPRQRQRQRPEPGRRSRPATGAKRR